MDLHHLLLAGLPAHGCPISTSLTTYCVCLELRLLPSTGVTRLQRYYEPLRHPKAPGLSVTGHRLIVSDHAKGLPVLRALSLCTCCRHYPGAVPGGTASLFRPVMSAFPERVVGSACASSFSRFAQRSLALRPAHSRCHQFVARLSEGFSYFVSSIAAPVASGRSGCRVGLAPTGKRRLVTAHTLHGLRLAGLHLRGGHLARHHMVSKDLAKLLLVLEQRLERPGR